jgi:two-component system alkaline phosphatase synthesis response regulator PhoP
MKNTKKKILLVDDDLDLLEQHKLLLEARGYEVVTADTVKSALEVFKQEKPDAAILDLIMEEHDAGFILAHKIKTDKDGRNIPVYLLTSATYTTGLRFGASTEEEKDWIDADGWIDKPVRIDELVSKLEEGFKKYNRQ